MKITTRPITREEDFTFGRGVHHAAFREVVERQLGTWDPHFQRRVCFSRAHPPQSQHLERGTHNVAMLEPTLDFGFELGPGREAVLRCEHGLRGSIDRFGVASSLPAGPGASPTRSLRT